LLQLIAEIRNRFSRSKTAADAPSQFVNLAPTDTADEAGVYAKALKAAIKDPNLEHRADRTLWVGQEQHYPIVPEAERNLRATNRSRRSCPKRSKPGRIRPSPIAR
jgi:hypothetical protein